MLDVCLLGSGGMMPLPYRFLTALMTRYNGSSLLIDCGEGTQVAVKEKGWSFKPIDVICFTHYHGDHISGLPGLLLTMGNADRREPLTLIGPKGLERVVSCLRVIAPELPFPIIYQEIQGAEQTFELNGYRLKAFRVNHNVLCYGYTIEIDRAGKFDVERARANEIPQKYWSRLQNGETVESEMGILTPDMVLGPQRKGIKLTYTTDTRPTDSIRENAKDSDLFICEGMYGEKEKAAKAVEYKHMTFYEAAELAKEANVGEMWLTHYSPSLTKPEHYMNDVKKIFPRAKAGKDGMSVDLMFEDERREKMKENKDVTILAIESSCDETAAAVVRNGREVLSNVISSQIDLHKLYGGVVPEIASRKHIEKINQVIEEALSEAGTTLDEIDAIGVTYGPGLVGALLVGVAEAKAIAWAKDIPLVGVHHIEGHISANYIEHPDLEPPFVCLVASGGHTHLVCVKEYGKYEILGRTRDDAAGEAYDKVARAIGLGYPGGPKIDRIAKEGNPDAIQFPKAKVNDAEYDFSFSGLKSAVLNYINGCKMKGETFDPADLAASFQKAVVEVLVGNSMRAAEKLGMKKFAIAGGVASNSALREAMEEACEKRGMKFYRPSPIYCTDNAAMIGAAAYYEYLAGTRSGWDLNAVPNLKLGER